MTITTTISGLLNLPVSKVAKGNCIPFQLNFQAPNAYVIDPTAVYTNRTFGALATIFVDNSTNPNPILVGVSGSNQTFEIPPYSGGAYPLAGTPGSSTVSLSSNGGASTICNVQLYDYVIEPFSFQSVPASGGSAITIADGANVTQGTKTDAVATTPLANSWSVVSLLKGILNAFQTALPIIGNVSAGTADSGNGVKVSGVFSAALPTYTGGQRGDVQLTSKGSVYATLISSLGTVPSITSPSADAQATGNSGLLSLAYSYVFNGTTFDRHYSGAGSAAGGGGIGASAVEESGRAYSNITTATTTVVKSGKGNLHSIIVNTPAAGTITIYDNTAASGTKIGTITVTAGQAFALPNSDVAFITGLTIVTSVAMDITVSYR